MYDLGDDEESRGIVGIVDSDSIELCMCHLIWKDGKSDLGIDKPH